MNKITLGINVCADDRTTEEVIIASDDLECNGCINLMAITLT